MKMYRTSKWSFRIDETEAEKVSEKSVWIGGRRNDRLSSYHNYFETWEDAKNFIVSRCESNFQSANRLLDKRRSELETAKALKRVKDND